MTDFPDNFGLAVGAYRESCDRDHPASMPLTKRCLDRLMSSIYALSLRATSLDTPLGDDAYGFDIFRPSILT